MKFLFDFFPILLFFIIYKLYGIYPATAVAIAGSIVQNAFYWYRHRKFENMHLVTLALIIILGGATLLFQNKAFIMWKPTAVYWAFAVAFFASQFIGEKPLIQRMMGHAIEVPARIWRNANLSMALFSVLLGVANLYVANFYFVAEQALLAASDQAVNLENCAATYSGAAVELCQQAKSMESIWVNFKLFGMLVLSVVFLIGLGVYLSLHVTEQEETTTPSVEPGKDS
ncbi:inner membrane-spanning protein YciB [Thiohalophilus thiocyanatoxydans]|uniref:Inner membrane-spanning protein YciB n=1 Tax=Thiohalophilus thiocyanatoxydans TaxID=381308 RepID=A0A4R8IP03_9GAMM|nr:inner membrane-spanning protein YciB [Thiohalophilus thiocyanatoxydans]TDY02626.1 intracellular septation protein [Thiohalophilus thiocyanatoxydans]